MRDARPLRPLLARSSRQPDAQAHRTDVRNRLGQETEAVVERVANNHRQVFYWSGALNGGHKLFINNNLQPSDTNDDTMSGEAAATKRQPRMAIVELTDLSRAEVESALRALGVEPYRPVSCSSGSSARRERLRVDDGPVAGPAAHARGTLQHFGAGHCPARHVCRRHREVPAVRSPTGARSNRVFIPDTGSQTFCVSTQSDRDGLRVPASRPPWICPAPPARRDCGTGAAVGGLGRSAREGLQHRSDGNGRTAAQLRPHDGGAAHPL